MEPRPTSRADLALLGSTIALLAVICWPASAGAGGHLAITAADHAILRWDHLAVERGEVVDIALPDSSSRVLIQLTGPRPADIAGQLVSNGHVYLVAPHGVQIHPGALVRSAGLWISTTPISEDAFSRGETVESVGRAVPEARIVHGGVIESRRQAGGRAGDRAAATIGGSVVLLGKEITVRDGAVIDASGDLGGGPIAIGGGSKGDDPRLVNADVVHVGRGARILADAAREGNGGDVVVWAEKLTTFVGSISSTGAGMSGNGGNAEVSSKGTLIFDGHAALSSTAGGQGRLLIDPDGLTIQAADPNIDGLGQGRDITSPTELVNTGTFPDVNSVITAGALNGLLTGGVSLTLAVTTSITVNAAVTVSGPGTKLILDAPTVNLNSPITLASGGALAGTAATVNVGPSGTIQNGVDAAAPGATVNLASATYVQEVKITKSLVLQGQGAASTTIMRRDSPSLTNTFVFALSNVTYHPIVLVESAAPIAVPIEVTVRDLTVDGNPTGTSVNNVNLVGIGYHNANGTIRDVVVTRIKDFGIHEGAQHGDGIMGGIDDPLRLYTITVLDSEIDGFQKRAVVMRGPTLTAVIANNTVAGRTTGDASIATANGIVITHYATAVISNNTVTGIISFLPPLPNGNNAAAILLLPAGKNSSVTGNTVVGSNYGIYSVTAGANAPTGLGNLTISGNTVSGTTAESIYVSNTNGLTTLTGNILSCAPPSPDIRTVNMDLESAGDQPFVLANNQLSGCDVGLLVQGGGSTGPRVTMDHDAFVGTAVNYIQLVAAPLPISAQTVSFDGRVAGQMTQAEFDQIQAKIVDAHDDPALGVVLEFIEPTPRLRIAKTTLPVSFTVGVPGSYALTVTNDGIVPTTADATVIDDVPASLTVGDVTGSGCVASGPQVTCTIPTGFAGGQVQTFLVPVTPTVSGTAVVNTARVSGGGDAGCPAATRCGATLTTSVTAPQLRLSKLATPASFAVGTPASYTLTVVNEGTAATSALTTVTDSVAATLTLGTLPASCTRAGQQVSCTIAAGFPEQAIAAFVIPVTPTVSGAIVNTARVSGGGDPGCPLATARCEATVTTSVTTPQLRVSKQATPTSFAVGAQASYTLAVVNEGTAATTALTTVTDSMAATLTLGTLPTSCTAIAQQVTCLIAAGLPAQATRTFLIPVTPTASGAVVNTARVSGGGDPGCPLATTRCEATITTSIEGPQLRVSKQATPTSFSVGTPASYTLAVVNEGTAATTATTAVTDIVAATLTLGTMPAGCTASAQQVTCAIPTGFASGATATFVIPVTPTVVGSAVNTVRVSGGGDPGCPLATARCEATITTAITSPQLRVSTQAAPIGFSVGAEASYTLTVVNEGTAVTTAITTVTDSVAATLTLGAMPAGCTAIAQQVTCTIPAGFAPGTTATFVIPVTPTVTGPVVNTVRVSGGGDPGCPLATARCDATITTTVAARVLAEADTAQLRVTKAAAPPTFGPGQPASYQLIVINEGAVATTAPVTLTDNVPDGLTLGVLPAGCSATGQVVTCAIASLAAGASVSFTLPVVPGAELTGTVHNTVTVSGGGDADCPLQPRCHAQVDVALAVVSFTGPSATGSGPITARFIGGGASCTFASAQFIAVTGDPASPPAGTAPVAVAFPHGLFAFTTTGCTPGSTITMTITYPSDLVPGTQYWKYGRQPGQTVARWYVLPATVSTRTITFSITDGELGDDDLLADGTIVDPGGPGSPAPVPTLSEWGTILLALFLLTLGTWYLARRPAR